MHFPSIEGELWGHVDLGREAQVVFQTTRSWVIVCAVEVGIVADAIGPHLQPCQFSKQCRNPETTWFECTLVGMFSAFLWFSWTMFKTVGVNLSVFAGFGIIHHHPPKILAYCVVPCLTMSYPFWWMRRRPNLLLRHQLVMSTSHHSTGCPGHQPARPKGQVPYWLGTTPSDTYGGGYQRDPKSTWSLSVWVFRVAWKP